MIKNNKKSIGPVVASALLLVVAVVSVVGFQTWFTSFSSSTLTGVESDSNSGIMSTKIENVIGDTLYFKNGGNKNITISSIKVDGVDCMISSNYSTGMNSIVLGNNCTQNLTSSSPEIVVISNSGIFSKKYYVKNNVNTNSQSLTSGLSNNGNGTWTNLSSGGGDSQTLGLSYISSVINNKIYLFGGTSDPTFLNSLIVYSPILNSWKNLTPLGTLPSIRGEPTSSTINNKTYFFGGYIQSPWTYYNDLYVYDPLVGIDGTWTRLYPSGSIPVGRRGSTSSVINGKMYVFGGFGVSYYNDLHVYDPTLNTWTLLSPTGSIPATVSGSKSSVINGKMYIFGGYLGPTLNNNLYVYDPILNTWTYLNPSNQHPPVRELHTSSVINGKMYIFGGYNAPNNYNDTYVYDPIINSWTNLTPSGIVKPAGLYGHTSSVINGEMYIFKGYNLLSSYQNTIWKFN